MNEYDSNRMVDLFKSKGYSQSYNFEDTNYYILNTCHIREKATEKVYHDIGRLKKIYKNKTKPIVLITGCVAQAENDEMLKREPYIDAVIGPQSYHNLPKILLSLENKNKKLNFTDFDVIEKFDKLNVIKNSNSKISAFITIQEGCDKFCSFCVVPYTRGSEHSRSPKDIINEANDLILNGVKEITLLGQNVNAYTFKEGEKIIKLSGLLKKLENIKEIKRIRYTTSHPNDMTNDLIFCHHEVKKLMPFLHLPVQSGSNFILKKMNRKHTKEQYISKIKKLKKINSEMNFSSDFIVGYPGETEKDFRETINLVKQVEFINSYSFIYSPRPGTPASDMDMVDPKVQKNRLIILQRLLENIQKNKNKKDIGKIKEVLVENKLKDQSKYFGRTRDLTPVFFEKGNDQDIGDLVNIKIDSCNQHSLFGTKIFESEAAA